MAQPCSAGSPGATGAEGGRSGNARARFIEGFVDASLVFVIGPLAILGSLSDGLGRGIEQLALKSVLDGFASVAFAASFGWGVAAAALSVAVVQGGLTTLGAVLGGLLPEAHVAALTATGGLVLVGVVLRLLRLRSLPVGDLLSAFGHRAGAVRARRRAAIGARTRTAHWRRRSLPGCSRCG